MCCPSRSGWRWPLDDNSAALATVLRQAEVAGHQPLDVLTTAITERELGNARSIASVLHHRITDRVDLEPKGSSHGDWTPRVTDPAYQAHLDDLAAVADGRRDQLGELAAIEASRMGRSRARAGAGGASCPRRVDRTGRGYGCPPGTGRSHR